MKLDTTPVRESMDKIVEWMNENNMIDGKVVLSQKLPHANAVALGGVDWTFSFKDKESAEEKK